MIPVVVKTLIVFAPPAPSALILEPASDFENPNNAEIDEPGVYRIVPIWVGVHEALQLGNALEHIKNERPSTHDLFTNALTCLDTRVKRVEIVNMRGKLFDAVLTLEQYGREIQIAARPSDAIALALVQDASIFMTKEILAAASFPYIVRNTINEEEALESFRGFLENVAPDDFL